MVVSLICTTVFSQTLESAISLGEGGRNFASDIVQTSSGDIIVIGATTGVTNFNPKGNPHNIVSPGEIHLANAYIARYNKDMELLWVNSLGFESWEMANELVLDEDENIYVMGYGSRIDFDPSINEEIWDFTGESFIVKYGSDGTFKAWNTVTGQNSFIPTPGRKIMIGPLGNVYVYKGLRLSKYNSNLELEWRKEIGGQPELFYESELYCIRSFTGVLYRPSEAQKEIVLERYDLATCNLIDTMLLGYTTGSVETGFITKAKNNDLLVYGNYWGDLSIYGDGDTVEAHNYELDTISWVVYDSKEFICRYNDAGNLIWAKVFEDKGPSPSLLETDEDGNIYILGNIKGQVNFDPINPKIDIPLDESGCYIAKYDNEFNYLAKHQFGGMNMFVHRFRLYDDKALMAGSFSTPIDLDLTSSVNLFERHNNEDLGNAAFMARFSDFDLKNERTYFVDDDSDNPYFNVGYDPSGRGGSIYIYINSEYQSDNLNTIVIYDMRGRLLRSIQSNQDVLKVDVSKHAEAVYLISIGNKEWSATEKIVKLN